jgi:hypothetical protein
VIGTDQLSKPSTKYKSAFNSTLQFFFEAFLGAGGKVDRKTVCLIGQPFVPRAYLIRERRIFSDLTKAGKGKASKMTKTKGDKAA